MAEWKRSTTPKPNGSNNVPATVAKALEKIKTVSDYKEERWPKFE
jgi:hypothetical protein